jgi:serine protease
MKRVRSEQIALCRLETLERRTLLAVTPNDPHYQHQWGLWITGAEEAWEHTTGDSRISVGVIDSGIDYTHPDLYRNIWVNQGEIPPHLRGKFKDTDKDGLITFYDLNSRWNRHLVTDVNGNGYIDGGDLLAPIEEGGWADGRDNAGNGYVDDIIGWDFAHNDNDPRDFDGHGTHVAGTIGAMSDNGLGVAGVAWKVSMMALKIFPDGDGGAGNGTVARAIRYAADNGAQMSNNSYGGASYSKVIYDAISYAGSKGHLFVAAAGNEGLNNDTSLWRSYPASYDLPNIVSVAASTLQGGLSSFSNYGKISVDLAAPGSNILSTSPKGKYAWLSGTSMATPHVTGTLALMMSSNFSLTGTEAVAKLFNGTVKLSGLAGTSRTDGEMHIARSMVASRRMPVFQSDQPQQSLLSSSPLFSKLPIKLSVAEELVA